MQTKSNQARNARMSMVAIAYSERSEISQTGYQPACSVWCKSSENQSRKQSDQQE